MTSKYKPTKSEGYGPDRWYPKGPGDGLGGNGCSPDEYASFPTEALADRAAYVAEKAFEAGRRKAQEEIRSALLKALGITVSPFDHHLKLF